MHRSQRFRSQYQQTVRLAGTAKVLIIDDSSYDRSRSKLVELLCRVYDHSTGRYLKGFRMLTVCWSDGVSCLPLDFACSPLPMRKSVYVTAKKS